MNTEAQIPVLVTQHLDLPPERVFDAWLAPETARRWFFATPSGEIVRAEIDARAGGRFTIVDRRDGEDVEHTGEYVEIDRPRRLVFDFSVPKFSAQVTRVSVDIAPTQSGCELTLQHDDVPAEVASRTQDGWRKMLERLSAVTATA